VAKAHSSRSQGNLFVAGQFALLAGLAFIPGGETWPVPATMKLLDLILMVAGLALVIVAGISLGRSLTANPVPLERAQLKTSGLYSVVRHPIYTGLLLVALGLTMGSGSLWHIAMLLALVVLLNFKARFEEAMLLEKFDGYAEYASRVGRLVPGVGKLSR